MFSTLALSTLALSAAVVSAASVDPAFDPFTGDKANLQKDVARIQALTTGTPFTTECVDANAKKLVVSCCVCLCCCCVGVSALLDEFTRTDRLHPKQNKKKKKKNSQIFSRFFFFFSFCAICVAVCLCRPRS
jgi:hypothetical protein